VTNRTLRIAALLVALSAVPITVRAVAQKGELVYDFTYSANQNITSRDAVDNAEAVTTSADNKGGATAISGGTNGMSHYGGTLTDKGTITVDLIKEQPDGAMVVMVSE
jgi:hypothetical protein